MNLGDTSAAAAAAKSLQSCPTPSNTMDQAPPTGPSVHGIFQARVLEWVAIAFSAWGHYCKLSELAAQSPRLSDSS